MLFNSYIYIFLFLPIAFFGYFFLTHIKRYTSSKIWLVASSLFFYSYWNIIYLPLIILSILFNYKLSKILIEEKSNGVFRKKQFFVFGLVANVSLLVYFKYMDFFISNINLFMDTDFSLLHLVLPLAISFFTLQQIAFLVDSYEGLVKEKDFLDYALFVSFFPQLIAGPIVHHQEMMPQFANIKNKFFQYENIAAGFFIFTIGLFKKIVIADSLSIWVKEGFDIADSLSFIEGWVTSLAYTFQIYFDFSGYTDMAIGSALLFNIKLPQNFNSPYKATGIIEYWKRWHITLTVFITTYVYTPIIRSFPKVTFFKAMLATFIAMFISGLWHGAGWTFIVWGSLHGFALVVEHYWKKTKTKMPVIFAWLITFNFINIAGVFFRAHEMKDAFKVLEAMFGYNGIMLPAVIGEKLLFLKNIGFDFGPYLSNLPSGSLIFMWLSFCFLISLLSKNSMQLTSNMKINVQTLFIHSILFFLIVLHFNKNAVFLYFNF